MSRPSFRTVVSFPKIIQHIATVIVGSALAISPVVSPVLQAQTHPNQPAATTITVNASDDPNPTSSTQTCSYSQGAIFIPASDGKCTLRRALREAAARPLADRPIAINFNLPITDTNKDLEVAGTWTLQIDAALPALKIQSNLNLLGQVTIDGNTQPGGRSNGPKIIIDNNSFSLEIESEENVIRNLSFKGGGVIFLKEDGNLIEKNWIGLTDDGLKIHTRIDNGTESNTGGGVFISSNGNTVQDNVITGARAKAVDINSGNSNNVIQRNHIGTRADGSVPTVAAAIQCLRSLDYDPENWYGGWGIAISGNNNKILLNRIAGLHRLQTANETPPMAIEIFGANHEIRENVIGVDSSGKKVGVCGQGIKVAGSNTKIISNTVVASRLGFEDSVPTAILANDSSPTFGRITVRGNLVDQGPGGIYNFGPAIPKTLQEFMPARITSIAGTSVVGSSGVGSPCPSCIIDLYYDDVDDIGETLRHLGSTNADSNGDFTFVMTQTLPVNIGIRTSSTSASSGVIGTYGAGTTTKFSKLYLPMSNLEISGPLTGSVGITHTITMTVSPVGATTPLSYTIKASDVQTQTYSGDATVLDASYRWTTPGAKTIQVTVKNDLGELSASHTITLFATEQRIYLPLVSR